MGRLTALALDRLPFGLAATAVFDAVVTLASQAMTVGGARAGGQAKRLTSD